MGIHTGTPVLTAGGYVGPDVHLGARIVAAAHGGQVLLSASARDSIGGGEATIDLVNLGEHRLKDFDAPVEILQLGTAAFPPLRTISNTNLPRPSSSFIGREHEVREIADRVRDGVRLLTLTGPGGSGKTRLAIEAAAELISSFHSGVFWIDLAPLRDPALVMPTIARTLGAQEDVTRYIAERELLLLVDNLEQVVDASSDLATLVERCPNLRLIATSRQRLRVRGEVELPVLPLADADAVRLFVERSAGISARATDSRDQGVLALVRALDNLPLAVELAAARASVLSPARILERLSARLDLLRAGRDADPRQQTLRATIEWSYDLLTPNEQRLFARLAVFRGGWDLDAAEAVAGADLDTLEALVDKSLVRVRDDRFTMLETIREYAAERLAASGDRANLERRHADHFAALAAAAEPHLKGTPRIWLDRLDAEHDNLRAALDRFEAAGNQEAALGLAGSLGRFWAMRGHYIEARDRLERLVALDVRPTAALGRALNALALVLLTVEVTADDRARACAIAERAAAVLEVAGDRWGAAQSRFLLGSSLIQDGRLELARATLEGSAAEFEALGDTHYALLAARQLAWAHFELGDLAGARARHEEVVRRARNLGNVRMNATSLGALAEYDIREGRLDDAGPRLRESTRLWVESGEPLEVIANLMRFAWLWDLRGDPLVGARLLAKARAMEQDLGGAVSWMRREAGDTEVHIRSQISEPEWLAACAAGTAMSTAAAIELASAAPSPARQP
jgi:predicted ATPase